MVATCKAESESEEIRDKGHSSDWPREGTVEFGKQIAKLIAVLTQAGHSKGPSSMQVAPVKGVTEGMQ